MVFERWTDRARKVAELSLREALQMGVSYVGTEHILLGLIREGEGVAAQVLVNDLGLDLATVRQAVIRRLTAAPHKHVWKVVAVHAPEGAYDEGLLLECCSCGSGVQKLVPNQLPIEVPDA